MASGAVQITEGTVPSTPSAGVLSLWATATQRIPMVLDESAVQGVINAEQIEVLSGTYTLANDASAHPLFNGTTNGAVTLLAATTYEFEMMVAISGLSSSAHTVNLTFATSGSFTSIGYFYDAQTGSTLAGPTATLSGFVAVGTATAVIASTTTTGLVLRVRGVIRMNAGGTVTPQITQVTNTTAAVVQTNSFFRCWPIGTNTVVSVGNWS